ncbi:hypothetical protein [Terricaulis sp.]|uniref:hypothetical protein n=1 Tax=Terricaulis sp. TaxID=2768686 RepID=UPI0037833A34
MAQLVTAILKNQGELDAVARQYTGDVNEAGLLVGQVVCGAFSKFEGKVSNELIAKTMRRDLDVLIEKLRKRQTN